MEIGNAISSDERLIALFSARAEAGKNHTRSGFKQKNKISPQKRTPAKSRKIKLRALKHLSLRALANKKTPR
jgi:hypothetical protein